MAHLGNAPSQSETPVLQTGLRTLEEYCAIINFANEFNNKFFEVNYSSILYGLQEVLYYSIVVAIPQIVYSSIRRATIPAVVIRNSAAETRFMRQS